MRWPKRHSYCARQWEIAFSYVFSVNHFLCGKLLGYLFLASLSCRLSFSKLHQISTCKSPESQPCCNKAVPILFWERKKVLHHTWLCSASKTSVLSKCQPAHAGLQRFYLYLEAGHCYCAAPHKAHTTYWKQANAINNMEAIHRWNAGRGWIQPDLEDTLPTGHLQSHRWPVCMPAHDTQTLVKGSRETFEVYASQSLCLYEDPILIFWAVHYNLPDLHARHVPAKMAG